MGETETTTPANVDPLPEQETSIHPDEDAIAPEEINAAEETTAAADTSSSSTTGATSLDTDKGADQVTSSGGSQTETQPLAGEASSPKEDDISYPDYSAALDDIYIAVDGQNVLLEDYIKSRTEEQLKTAELNAQRFDFLTQKLDRLSDQFGACISIMFIFVLIILLNYCYKFLRLFF